MNKEDILNNYNMWSKAVSICKMKKNTTLNEMADDMSLNRTSPYFYNFINFLRENNFLELIDDSRKPFIFKVKWKELAEFLENGEPAKKHDILIKIRNGLKPYWY